jgi:hypothetical protein
MKLSEQKHYSLLDSPEKPPKSSYLAGFVRIENSRLYLPLPLFFPGK